MPDRIAHDHPTVETIAARIERHGGTTRPEVVIEEPLEVEPETLVRLVLSGREYRARVEASDSGSVAFRHAARSPTGARSPGTGKNALTAWIETRELEIGRPLHLDVVDSGFRYGLRAPGEDVTYDVSRPDHSLAAIARNLDERERDD
ncbi:MAG: hypothetical protein ABEJ84_05840 [Halodesulfurarchaeum sp.]